MNQQHTRLVRVAVNGSPRWGVIENERVYTLEAYRQEMNELWTR